MKAEGAYFVDDKVKPILAKNCLAVIAGIQKVWKSPPTTGADVWLCLSLIGAYVNLCASTAWTRRNPLSGEKLTTV